VHLVSDTSIFTKLFRIGATYQKEVHGKEWGTVGRRAIAVATMNELHTDSVSELQTDVVFPLSGEQRERALEVLDKLGLTENMYSCMQDRDTLTVQSSYDATDLNEAIGVHVFDTMRQTSLDSLFQGADELDKVGVRTVRVGVNPIRSANHPTILDYASKYRKSEDDFSDIALLAHCKFFLGPGSGIQLCTKAFNRPVCLINAFPWPWTENPMRRNSLVIPKKYWLRNEQRFMKISEMVELEEKFYYKEFYNREFIDNLGIDVVENTSEEMTGAILEINARLDNSWEGPDYPVRKFLKPSNAAFNSEAYMAAKFIELNPELF
jgi:putative glycosyltransferase (TIGR04372 family)